MKIFRDTLGREWPLEINYAALKRVRDLAGIDLTKLGDPEADDFRKLQDDPILVFDCLCACLRPEMERKGITADELGNALDEECGEAAGLALMEATVDFFRGSKRRLLGHALTRTTETLRKRRTEAEATIGTMLADGSMDRLIDQSLGSSSATSSPDSSGSTPDHTPSAS